MVMLMWGEDFKELKTISMKMRKDEQENEEGNEDENVYEYFKFNDEGE